MTRDGEPGLSDASSELVPVVELGAPGLALPPPGGTQDGETMLGDLLADALFGEVIDISDLLSSVLSAAADEPERAIPGAEAAAPTGIDQGDAGAFAAADHLPAFSILYDDDLLASDGTFL